MNMQNLELSLDDLQTLTLLAAQAPDTPERVALLHELKSETARRIADILQQAPSDNEANADDPIVKTAEAIRDWVRRSRAMRATPKTRNLEKAREYAKNHFREEELQPAAGAC